MGKKLFIGNLPYETGDADLEKLFSELGKVESAAIITDRNTGRSRGFGFVEMVAEEDVAKAIEKLNGSDLSGRNIVVAEARPREESPAEEKPEESPAEEKPEESPAEEKPKE